MLVLGIETSCDETAAAVLRDGRELQSNIISNQTAVHSRYGGVVPELAGRVHIENIRRVIEQALAEAGVGIGDIGLIAVTRGPGLMSSLLVGLNVAKGMAYAGKIPLIGVNHLEGHLLAIFLQEQVEFPYVSLGISGGHTELYRVDDFVAYTLLGRTRDDAAGESFDKVARMLNLGYPGGPLIERLAQEGDTGAHRFPRPLLEPGSLDFSFSGLKTAVRQKIESNDGSLSDADIAACFQDAVIDVLVRKMFAACEREGIRHAVLTGGVAANGALRRQMEAEGTRRGVQVFSPKPVFCTDNAAMIACAGYHRYMRESRLGADPLSLDASATLPIPAS
jgi:N6-L-threonylcarbamoyladenine synthase